MSQDYLDKDCSLEPIVKILKFIVLGFGFSIPLISSLGLAYFAWEDWCLRQDLIEMGIPTQATVQSSSYYRGCTVNYEFLVTTRGQIEKYIGQDDISGRCPSNGSSVSIKYVRQNPDRSGVEGNSRVRHHILLSIIILFIYPIMFVVTHWNDLKERARGWLSSQRKGGKADDG